METYLPLKLVKTWSNLIPTCWDEIEDMRNKRGSVLPDWDNLCYIPIAGTLAVVSRGESMSSSAVPGAQQLAALAPWRIHKEVYRFTPEMETTLFEQAKDCIIPVDIIRSLPFPCLYIELSSFSISNTHGFFVHFEHDANDGRKELRFLLVSNDEDTFPISIHLLPNGNIQDGIEAFHREAIRHSAKEKIFFDVDQLQYDAEIRLDIASKLLQLVLYICAENAEIDENPDQKIITRKPFLPEYTKDKFREIRKWDVGIHTTNALKNIESSNKLVHFNQVESAESRSGTTKRPHPRCGHWHHFWTGPHASSERKLILRWVAPTYINMNRSDLSDLPVVIREIKSDYDN